MKISYNDMFTNISDVAYEILEENDMFNDETDDMFSSDRTCKDVTDMIHDQKIVEKGILLSRVFYWLQLLLQCRLFLLLLTTTVQH